MKKVYCEHGALNERIRDLGTREGVELVHFPYDADSYARLGVATASKARICDLNLPIEDLPGAFANYSGSARLKEIFSIINGSNRVDALHIDSAYKHGCLAFVTADRDILDHKDQLQNLLGIRFFHPAEWGSLERFLEGPA